MTAIECIPTKCSYLLLPKLFYGLFIYSKNNQAHISINNRKYKFFGDGKCLLFIDENRTAKWYL